MMLSALKNAVRCLRLSSSHQVTIIRSKIYTDRSKLPTLSEKDLEENFISGSGPGGQSVNKSVNCCQLKHIPTGIVVKCHQHRMLQKNRELARKLMVDKLDDYFNGEDSISAQKKRIEMERSRGREIRRERLQSLKEEFRSNMKPSKGSRAMVNKESDDGDQ